MTKEEYFANLDRWVKCQVRLICIRKRLNQQVFRKIDYIEFWFEELLRESIKAAKQGYFQLLREGYNAEDEKPSEFRQRIIRAKSALGDFRRDRYRYTQPDIDSEVQDWFKRFGRNFVGVTQEGSNDSRSKDITG